MRIELDELNECPKCGTIYNFTIAGKKGEFNYDSSYYGKCPVCKTEFLGLE